MPIKCTRRCRRLASLSPAVRLYKAADAEVAKHRRHPRRDQKAHVRVIVRNRLMQRCAHLPRVSGSEHGKNPEENPSQLQPQRTRKPDQRSAHRLAKPLTAFLQPLPRLSHLRCRPRSLLPQPNPGRLYLTGCSSRRRSRSRNRLRTLFRFGSRRWIRRRRRIHRRHQRLDRCTSPDTKRTAKSHRIHTQSVVVPATPTEDGCIKPTQQRHRILQPPTEQPHRSTRELESAAKEGAPQ